MEKQYTIEKIETDENTGIINVFMFCKRAIDKITVNLTLNKNGEIDYDD